MSISYESMTHKKQISLNDYKSTTEQIIKVKDRVKYLLEKYKIARNEDHILIFLYLKEFLKINIPQLLEIDASLESITRARRYWQSKIPELKADSEVQDRRKDLEMDYRYIHYTPEKKQVEV